jgi:hypothetical protein
MAIIVGVHQHEIYDQCGLIVSHAARGLVGQAELKLFGYIASCEYKKAR